MKVGVFEWLTGGGSWVDQVPVRPSDSMLSQGGAMMQAAAEDFRLGGHEVTVLLDPRWPIPPGVAIQLMPEQCTQGEWQFRQHQGHGELKTRRAMLREALVQLAETNDALVVVAPESERKLEQVLEWIAPWRDRLLVPGLELVRLAGQKSRLETHLVEQGFERLPASMFLGQYRHVPPKQRSSWYPMVVKPDDGAGGECVFKLENEDELSDWMETSNCVSDDMRLEVFVDGTPVSISVVVAEDGSVTWLPPSIQRFEPDSFGCYRESDFAISDELAARARTLAADVLPCLPRFVGFIGMDLVIGASQSQDYLIEINPRLTSSYPALAAKTGFRLSRLLCG